MIYSHQFRKILQTFKFSVSIQKTLSKSLHHCKQQQEIFRLYQKNQESFTPKLMLESLKMLTKLPNNSRGNVDDAKREFINELVTTFQDIPTDDKWRIYVQLAKKKLFKTQVRELGQQLTCSSLKQIAILLWAYRKNEIKKPRYVMKIIDQIQKNLDKLDIIDSQQKVIGEEQESDDEIDFEDVEGFEDEVQQDTLTNYKYEFKDLVLILWSVQDIKLDMSEFLRYVFRTAIKNKENSQLISTKSLLLLLQSTEQFKLSKEITVYHRDIVEHLETQDLSNQSILLLIQYVKFLSQTNLSQEQGINITKLILKKQQKLNQSLSTKFSTILLWSLNKLQIEDVSLYNQIGLMLIKHNLIKPIEITQCLQVFLQQKDQNPNYQQYDFLIKELLKKVQNNRIIGKDKQILLDIINKYNPSLQKYVK